MRRHAEALTERKRRYLIGTDVWGHLSMVLVSFGRLVKLVVNNLEGFSVDYSYTDSYWLDCHWSDMHRAPVAISSFYMQDV